MPTENTDRARHPAPGPPTVAATLMVFSIGGLIALFLIPPPAKAITVGVSVATGVLGAAARALALVLTATGSDRRSKKELERHDRAQLVESFAALPVGAAYGLLTYVLAAALAVGEVDNSVLSLYAFLAGFFSAALLAAMVKQGKLLLDRAESTERAEVYSATLNSMSSLVGPYYRRPTNYDGYLTAKVDREIDRDGKTVDRVMCVFNTDKPKGAATGRVLIANGNEADVCVLSLVVRASEADVLPSELTMEVPTDGISEPGMFRVVRSGEEPVEPEPYVIVISHLGRTVQIVEVPVPATPGD